MKAKTSLFTILGLAACCWAGFAQNNEPAPSGDNSAAGNQVQPATPPGTDGSAAKPDSAAPTPTPTPGNAAEAPAPASGLVAANEPAKADAPKAEATTTNAADANASTNASSGAVIPLIVMDDVPLTDAIKNLARQAGLNYMLDPKISFGQPGPNGQPTPQPSVSIRWENVTAEQALNALLNNYSLQLVEDPKTRIYRVTVKDQIGRAHV